MKIWTCHRQITVKIDENSTIINLKPEHHNINAYTKFGKNPLRFTKVIIQKRKYGRVAGRKLKQSMHTPTLVKIHLYRTYSSYQSETKIQMDGWADRQTDTQTTNMIP